MQENVETVVELCNGKWRAIWAGIIESEVLQSAAKIPRLELAVSTSNAIY